MIHAPPIIRAHDGVLVLRDDLRPGGTKARVIPALIEGTKEVVFGGPFCGGAPVALAVIGLQLGIAVTIFYAKRKEWHPRQLLVQRLGATLRAVPMDFMAHVQCRAKEYAQERGALFLPLGYDVELARLAMLEYMQEVRAEVGALDHLVVSMGTGMLAKCAALTWPEAHVLAVAVGLKSRWKTQEFPANLEVVEWPTGLDVPMKKQAPFPCDPYYDRKAWWAMRARKLEGLVLYWNVLGEPEAGNCWELK